MIDSLSDGCRTNGPGWSWTQSAVLTQINFFKSKPSCNFIHQLISPTTQNICPLLPEYLALPDTHLSSLSTRQTSVCYLVYRLNQVLDAVVLLKAYYGCSHSLIKYGIFIVLRCNSPDAPRICLLQKPIIQTIYLAHCK